MGNLSNDWPSFYRGFKITIDPRTRLEGDVVVRLNLCAMSCGETLCGDSWSELKEQIDAGHWIEN